jgi:WhiB family redox-sensing transcriptional regulator
MGSAMTHAVLLVVWTPRPEWFDEAVCRGVSPSLFFPDRGDMAVAQRARAICAVCPVRRPCLEYALANDEHHGIWGGTTGHQRAAMRRRV